MKLFHTTSCEHPRIMRKSVEKFVDNLCKNMPEKQIQRDRSASADEKIGTPPAEKQTKCRKL